jgi:hypothetical protein
MVGAGLRLLHHPAAAALTWQGELVRNCLRKSPAPLIDIGVNLVDHAFEKVNTQSTWHLLCGALQAEAAVAYQDLNSLNGAIRHSNNVNSTAT